MKFRFILFFFGIIFFSSCDNQQIVGKWEREVVNLDTVNQLNNLNWGDITFNPDSTFLMGCNHAQDSSKDSIPGWHSDNLKGTWRVEEKRLLLKPEELSENIFLTYEIIKLTNKKLVLLSLLDKGDKTKYLYYSRKK